MNVKEERGKGGMFPRGVATSDGSQKEIVTPGKSRMNK